MFTTYSWDQLQNLLNGDPTEALVQQKFMSGIQSLTRQQVSTFLHNILKDENLVQSIIYANQRDEDGCKSQGDGMSDEVIELLADVNKRQFLYAEPDKLDLYRNLYPELATIVRDYIIHKYLLKN